MWRLFTAAQRVLIPTPYQPSRRSTVFPRYRPISEPIPHCIFRPSPLPTKFSSFHQPHRAQRSNHNFSPNHEGSPVGLTPPPFLPRVRGESSTTHTSPNLSHQVLLIGLSHPCDRPGGGCAPWSGENPPRVQAH